LIASCLVTMALLNWRTIFQHMHCKLLISYVIIYVLSIERPTNINKSILQELPFSITLHIKNILSFSIWVRTNTNLHHCILIDKFLCEYEFIHYNCTRWILQLLKILKKKSVWYRCSHHALCHIQMYNSFIKKSNANEIIIFNSEILEFTLNNPQLIQSFFPQSQVLVFNAFIDAENKYIFFPTLMDFVKI
jgi:hypothetical protein